MSTAVGCNECGRYDVKLLACGGCRKVFYCGAPCAKSDWAAHKPSCQAEQAAAEAFAELLKTDEHMKIGEAYASGVGVSQDLLKAAEHFERAGDGEGFYEAGVCLMEVPEARERAADLFRRSAESRYALGQSRWGLMLAQERNDVKRGEALMREAAETEQAQPEVLYNLAVWLLEAQEKESSGQSEAEKEAWKLFERAAEAGLPQAHFNLAVLAERYERNDEARVHLQAAADLNHAPAWVALGYRAQQEGAADQGLSYFRKAVALGYRPS